METGLYLIVSLESSRRTNERSHRFQLMTFRLCSNAPYMLRNLVKKTVQMRASAVSPLLARPTFLCTIRTGT